jgi:hypothetical protein
MPNRCLEVTVLPQGLATGHFEGSISRCSSGSERPVGTQVPRWECCTRNLLALPTPTSTKFQPYTVQRSSHAQWSSFFVCGLAYSDSPLHNFLSYHWSTFRKRTIGRSSRTFTCVKFFFLLVLNVMSLFARGTRWRSWLRHCATNQKVACLIPDGVTGIFQCLNPSGRIVTLGSTQPLKMSTRNPSWG